MLDKEELLFDELYEKTKGCGRTQFIKLLMEKEKVIQELQIQNLNLRTDIMIQKQALPSKEIKDKTFYELYDMPTYEELIIQQTEFIEWLEDLIKLHENDIQNFKKDYKVYFSLINDLRVSKAKVEEILQKYKEIIGDDK